MLGIEPPILATASFFVVFFALAFTGIPLAIALGLSSLVVTAIVGRVYPYLIVKAYYQPFSSFALIAIFLFVFMGVVFQKTGLASLLVQLLYPLVGRKRYGIPYIGIIGSAIFGLLTGSAVATAATFSLLLGSEMEKRRYPREHVAAVLASAGPLGALIPPSIPALVLSVATNTSVLTNFAVVGSLGIVATISLLIWESIISNKYKYGEVDTSKYPAKTIVVNMLRALPLLSVPIGVLGSIYTGLLSVSEAGAIGGLISLILAIAYRRLNFKILCDILITSAATTASVFFLISTSYMLSYVWSMSKVYVVLNNILVSVSQISPLLTLLFTVVLLLILGMFLDLIIFNITLAPVIAAVLRPIGINPYHINAIFALGNLIGTVTPPIGTVLFTTVKAIGASIDSKIMKEAWVMLVPYLILYLLLIVVPDLALWLPKLLGLPL
ncbi:MAG: TRAP transporter large permease subunit [Zestosphaera sp.]